MFEKVCEMSRGRRYEVVLNMLFDKNMSPIYSGGWGALEAVTETLECMLSPSELRELGYGDDSTCGNAGIERAEDISMNARAMWHFDIIGKIVARVCDIIDIDNEFETDEACADIVEIGESMLTDAEKASFGMSESAIPDRDLAAARRTIAWTDIAIDGVFSPDVRNLV